MLRIDNIPKNKKFSKAILANEIPRKVLLYLTVTYL